MHGRGREAGAQALRPDAVQDGDWKADALGIGVVDNGKVLRISRRCARSSSGSHDAQVECEAQLEEAQVAGDRCCVGESALRGGYV